MKIFADAEEKYVANFKLFADSTHLFTYTDSAMTKKATKAEVVNMFEKGVIVDYGGALYAPIACNATGDTASLVIATVASSAITLVTLASA